MATRMTEGEINVRGIDSSSFGGWLSLVVDEANGTRWLRTQVPWVDQGGHDGGTMGNSHRLRIWTTLSLGSKLTQSGFEVA